MCHLWEGSSRQYPILPRSLEVGIYVSREFCVRAKSFSAELRQDVTGAGQMTRVESRGSGAPRPQLSKVNRSSQHEALLRRLDIKPTVRLAIEVESAIAECS